MCDPLWLGLILRQQLLACTFLFGTVSACAFAQNTPNDLQKELVAADKGIWQAIAGLRSNMDQVSSALASDYVDIDSGVVHSRKEVFEYLHGLTKFSFTYQSARAYVLSPTSGYVIAELSYSSVQNATAATGKVLTTTIFSKEQGRWMAHLHTEMEIKPPTQ